MDQVNTTDTGQTVVGVFDDVASAERAINDLKVAGFRPDTISVVTKDRRDQTTLTEATGNRADEGAIAGALGGGTLGAVLGWLLAGGTALIPGVGPVIAAGIFGATLTGALVGGALGSIASALVGQGIPDEEASEYEEHVRGGRTLLSVKAANGQLLQSALDVFDRNDATGVRYYNEGQTAPGRIYSRAGLTDTTSDTTDSDWTSTSTERNTMAGSDYMTTKPSSTPDHPVSLDKDNATRVDERDYGVLHTDESAPDYRDETYRSGDRTAREESRKGMYEANDSLKRDIEYTENPLETDTLPDRGMGTSTRGGTYNEEPRYGSEPLDSTLPRRDPDTNLPR